MRPSLTLLFLSLIFGALGACTTSRIGRKIHRVNAYRAFCQEARGATDLFYTHLPLEPAPESVVSPPVPTYFAYEGRHEAEGALRQALRTSEDFLRGEAHGQTHIPSEAVPEVSKVWGQRQDLLLLLGEMPRLEEESRFCLTHYQDSGLRLRSTLHLVMALAAQGKTSEARLTFDRHFLNKPLLTDSLPILTLRLYLSLLEGDGLRASEGFVSLLSSSRLSRHERLSLLRRQVDFAKKKGEIPLAVRGLNELKNMHLPKEQQALIDIELRILAPTDALSESVAQWEERTDNRGVLRRDVLRQLRDRAYADNDLYKVLRLYERLATGGGDGGIEAFRDSLRYAALSRVRSDLETMHRYEHRGRLRNNAPQRGAVSPLSSEERVSPHKTFREIWGDVSNHDFWAMSADRQPFGSSSAMSDRLHPEVPDNESYQSALIRVAHICVEWLSAPDKGAIFLRRCVATDPETPEGRHAAKLLEKLE